LGIAESFIAELLGHNCGDSRDFDDWGFVIYKYSSENDDPEELCGLEK